MSRISQMGRAGYPCLAIAAGVVIVGAMAPAPASAASSDVLSRIKSCESSGSYSAVNASSGASGAYQFIDSTWRTVPASAGYRRAVDAPAWVQDAAARQLLAREGTRPWASSAHCWQSARSVPTASVSTRTAAAGGSRGYGDDSGGIGRSESSASGGERYRSGRENGGDDEAREYPDNHVERDGEQAGAHEGNH
jgi:hypothetical protein